MNKTKSFDCVKTKRDIQEKLYEELKPTSLHDFVQKLQQRAEQSDLLRLLRPK